MRPGRIGCLIVGIGLTLAAYAGATSVAKPGYYTEIRDGRLWVFRDGLKELEDFKRSGEPAQHSTRVGAAPNGMTIKAPDAKVIDDYLAAN